MMLSVNDLSGCIEVPDSWIKDISKGVPIKGHCHQMTIHSSDYEGENKYSVAGILGNDLKDYYRIS